MRSALALLMIFSLPAFADHISRPVKKASPRVCVRASDGECKESTVGLDELKGQWHGNLTITDAAQFRKFARSSGLCKDAECAVLSPYMSLGIDMKQGHARYTLKTFSQGSAKMSVSGRNLMRLTPSKDGFMIHRQGSTTADGGMQIRMQIEEGAKPGLIVKIFVGGNVVAHGSING